MPQMADVTTKLANGTDYVMSALQPSAGDKSPAVWRQESEASYLPPAMRSTIAVTAKANQARTVRYINLNYQVPISVEDTSTGTRVPQGVITARVELVIPQNLASSHVENVASILPTFMNSTLMKSVVATQYAPS